MSAAENLRSEPRPEPRAQEQYPALVQRLSVQSVRKHFDAYADVDWEHPDLQIDPRDPRWELSSDDFLGATCWYRTQPQERRAAIGLHRIVSSMKVGVIFESVLQRGLLEFAARLPNGAVEFRYAYHEVIEEAQHSLMFQEFINRTGLQPPGLPPVENWGQKRVAGLGRHFPTLFFLFVLGGESPIDHVQRHALNSGRDVHPLVRRIMQIHITEEARHLCFARAYLREEVPKLPRAAKATLAVITPILLSRMAALMLNPGRAMVRRFEIPASVLREAYHRNPAHRAFALRSLAPVKQLCQELQVLTPGNAWYWRRLGLGGLED